jgi:RNA polymerase sigma-70 factor (ECF subfamily)
VVALNRAVAVAELRGPAAGLDELAGVALDDYQPFHAPRHLLARAGRVAEAAAAYDKAIALTPDAAERDFLARQRAAAAAS